MAMTEIAIIEEPGTCPDCGSDDLGVCCATPEREDEADLVACEKCRWQAALTPEGAVALRVEPTVTVTVGQDVAHGLLEVAQFERDARGRWVAPTGETYWQTDEALTYALAELCA
jgi:hypothetical protein